jgi:hypothetical protein
VDLYSTSIVLAVGVVISGAAIWLEHRPNDARPARWVPTTLVLMIGVLTILAAVIHLLTFLGRH